MTETKLTKKHLDEFLADLRYEDRLEFESFCKNSSDEFYKICLDKSLKTYFLTTDDNKPLALGGVYDFKGKKYKTASLWLLTTNKVKEEKVAFYRYINRKILQFKQEYDVLFNFIYKSNFDFLKFLKFKGFSIVDLKDCADYKLFYFSKGDKYIDIRYFTC